jgi:GTPase SAR1 family protein
MSDSNVIYIDEEEKDDTVKGRQVHYKIQGYFENWEWKHRAIITDIETGLKGQFGGTKSKKGALDRAIKDLWSKLEPPIQQEWKTISDLVRSDKFQDVMADLKQIDEPAIDKILDVVAKPEFQNLFPPELKSKFIDPDLISMVKQSIEDHGSLNVTVERVILYGQPGVGKTALKRRLIGEIKNIDPTLANPSTGIDTPITVPTFKSIESSLVYNWKSCDSNEALQICLNLISSSPSAAFHTQKKPVEYSQQSIEMPPEHDSSSVIHPIERSLPPLPSLVEECLASKNFKELREKLKGIENSSFLQIIDIGGQPEFHKIFPLLLSGQAIYILFINLIQKLDDPITYKFQHQNGRDSTSYTSQMTPFNMLHQILSSIDLYNDRSTAILVGTYLDKFKENHCRSTDSSATIREKIRSLKEQPLLDKIRETSYYRNSTLRKFGDHIIYPIDNVSGTPQEITELRELISKIMNIHMKSHTVPLPTPWAIFYFLLRDFPSKNEGKQFCTLAKANEMAMRLGIKDVEKALKYIHNSFGSVLFYDEVSSGGEKYVFCDPNAILKPVIELISICFGSNDNFSQIASELRKSGMITHTNFDKLCCSFQKSGDISVSYFVKLLKKRHILSKILTHITRNLYYFIPCLLDEERKTLSNSCSEADPLLLSFSRNEDISAGYVPPALFSALLVKLSTFEGWSLEPNDKRYKNAVTFMCQYDHGKSTDVLLIERSHFLEIQICTNNPLPQLCQKISNDIKNAIEEVKSSDSMLREYLSSVSHETGFYCPSCSHYAKKINAYQMKCTSEVCKSLNDLQEEHMIWFQPKIENISSEDVKHYQEKLRNAFEKPLTQDDERIGVVILFGDISSNAPNGTSKDLDRFKSVFKSLNYAVADFRNESCYNIVGISLAAAKEKYPESINSIIIYFSGHGGYDMSSNQAFIQKNKNRIDIYTNIIRAFEPEVCSLNQYRLFFFDCCLKDHIKSQTQIYSTPANDWIIPAHLPPRSKCLIAFSTSGSYTARGNKEIGGYFTSALLDNIEKYDLPLVVILEKTHDDVQTISGNMGDSILQGPHYSSTLGPFYFSCSSRKEIKEKIENKLYTPFEKPGIRKEQRSTGRKSPNDDNDEDEGNTERPCLES